MDRALINPDEWNRAYISGHSTARRQADGENRREGERCLGPPTDDASDTPSVR